MLSLHSLDLKFKKPIKTFVTKKIDLEAETVFQKEIENVFTDPDKYLEPSQQGMIIGRIIKPSNNILNRPYSIVGVSSNLLDRRNTLRGDSRKSLFRDFGKLFRLLNLFF